MDDRELLKMAALAAGVAGEWCECGDHDPGILTPNDAGHVWNPLASDGDALRLAVKIGMIIDVRYRGMRMRKHNRITYWLSEIDQCVVQFDENDDPVAATRRTIVRAAAAIGRQMEAAKAGE